MNDAFGFVGGQQHICRYASWSRLVDCSNYETRPFYSGHSELSLLKHPIKALSARAQVHQATTIILWLLLCLFDLIHRPSILYTFLSMSCFSQKPSLNLFSQSFPIISSILILFFLQYEPF